MFSRISAQDRGEDYASFVSWTLFPHKSVWRRDEENVSFASWPYSFLVIEFGAVARSSFLWIAW